MPDESIRPIGFGEAALLFRADGKIELYSRLAPDRVITEEQVGAFALAKCTENHEWYRKVKMKMAEEIRLEIAMDRAAAGGSGESEDAEGASG